MKQQLHLGMLFNCKCSCAWHPIQLVHTDGHIHHLPRPVTVAELLAHHPHHFVCEPTATPPLFHSGMLPPDLALEEGRIYLLLPLPRLLPHLSAGAALNPNPPSCPCFGAQHPASLSHGGDPIPDCDAPRTPPRRWPGRVVRSLVRAARRLARLRFNGVGFVRLRGPGTSTKSGSFKFQADDDAAALATGKSSSAAAQAQWNYCARNSNRWRPGLECISEVDLLLTGLLRVD